MQIKQLKIKSFRGIKDLALEFNSEQPNLLIGVNGSGKSSILDCLAILLSHFTEPIRNPDSSGDFFGEEDINNENKDGIASAEIIANIGDWAKPSAKSDREIKWSLTKTREGNNNDLAAISDVVDNTKNKIIEDADFALPIITHYTVNRVVRDIPLRVRKKNLFETKDAYYKSLARGGISFGDFFEWFRNQEDIENEERSNLFLKSLNELVAVMVEKFLKEQNLHHKLSQHSSNEGSTEFESDIINILKQSDNPNENFQSTPKLFYNYQLEAVRKAIGSILDGFSNLRVQRRPLKMIVEKQGKKLYINQLSDGEKCLLAMVGDLARRLAIANPGLENPLQGSGVVLIDEIELHLHPQWQRNIILRLQETFPNCQFIITTHSPQVISGVKYVTLLDVTPEGITAEQIPSYGKDSNRVLETIMGTSSRPQKIMEDLQQLFELIDRGNLDDARQLRDRIAEEMEDQDPEFTKADWLIERKEILKQ